MLAGSAVAGFIVAFALPSAALDEKSAIPPLASANAMGKVRWEHLLTAFDANGKMIEAWEQWNDKFRINVVG